MAAPLLAAAKYFGLPRLLGAGADAWQQERALGLINQGKDPSADTLLNLLDFVPRVSGAESLKNLYDKIQRETGADGYWADKLANTPDYAPAFHVVERESQDGVPEWYSPIDDYLTRGGQETSGAMEFAGGWQTPSAVEGGSFYNVLYPDENTSYGQTDMPAPEVTFDAPGAEWGSTGGMYRLLQEMEQQEQPEFFDDPGFARGGLLNLLRAHNAKYKR